MAELRTSPRKTKLERGRKWLRQTRTGPVIFAGLTIGGGGTTLLHELGFTDKEPARLIYCDGCRQWSWGPGHFAHNCGGRSRGWYTTLRRVLVAQLQRKIHPARRRSA